MAIRVKCSCGYFLQARDEFAGKRGQCPYCGSVLTIPAAVDQPPMATLVEKLEQATTPPKPEPSPSSSPTPPPTPTPRPSSPTPPPPRPREEAMEIKEFLDPPSRPPRMPTPTRKPFSFRPMFEAMLDPRSIQLSFWYMSW